MSRSGFRLIGSISFVALSFTAVSSAGAVLVKSNPSDKTAQLTAVSVPVATLGSGGVVETFSGTNSAVPTMPIATAPIASWQSWVAAWNASLNPQGIAASFQEAGCTVMSVDVAPIPATAAIAMGYPAGINPDGGSVVMNCTNATSVASMHPRTSPGAGYEEETVGGPGLQIVMGCVANRITTVCATYKYEDSNGFTITGHVELSTDGALATTCSVGNLVQNSQKTTLTDSAQVTVFDPVAPNFSTVWNGNFWKGSSNPYTNEGNACAAI